MNCPSRNDDGGHPDWNQSPPAFTADTTTREDLNGIANAREQREHSWGGDPPDETTTGTQPHSDGRIEQEKIRPKEKSSTMPAQSSQYRSSFSKTVTQRKIAHFWQEVIRVLVRYAHFVGPGFLIAVAYIDPGNYATDVAAGADTRFSLLFIVLMSNLFAIFLQSLCIKLGSVTGLNLAENCRAHLPTWLTIILYLFSEAAIIATDIAEVCHLCTCLSSLTNSYPGHRLSNCAQSSFPHSARRRLCDHNGGCLDHSLFLQSKRDYDAITTIRVLRHATGLRRCDMLLHPTLFHQKHHHR